MSVLPQKAVELAELYFQQYNELGRPMLDVLHAIFNNAFYAMLTVLAAISMLYFLTTIYVMINRKEPYKEKELQQYPFVTVQIPTRNELAALKCAEKCLEFDYPKDKYEILIGDDSDKEYVSARIKQFAEKHELVKVYKRANNSGYKAGNLNNLLSHSRGKYLALFDSDFLPGKDFIRRIISPMEHDSSIAGVQARWKYFNAGQNLVSILGASIGSVFHHIALPFFNNRKRLSVLCGSAEAVRKDTLIRLGGWEHGSLTEDIEYSLRLLENGHKIQYLPQLECENELPFTPADLYRQQKRWAYGVLFSLREHFKTLFLGKKLDLEEKLLVSYIFSGYMLSMALASVVILGALSIITHEPAPIDFGKFFFESARNIAATSGLLFAGIYGLIKIGYGKRVVHMLLAAFSIGLIVTYHVNVGILRVLAGKPMQWYLLNKKGNTAGLK
ncbi:glycosyltransferase [Candidatus Woesearchaeota archaeon]|nr:glycosyltransferase [Candidatus Woesearchaeota archaeon]